MATDRLALFLQYASQPQITVFDRMPNGEPVGHFALRWSDYYHCLEHVRSQGLGTPCLFSLDWTQDEISAERKRKHASDSTPPRTTSTSKQRKTT